MKSHHFAVCMQAAFGLKILYQCKTVKEYHLRFVFFLLCFLYIVHLFLDQTVQQSSSVDVCRVCRYLHISPSAWKTCMNQLSLAMYECVCVKVPRKM